MKRSLKAAKSTALVLANLTANMGSVGAGRAGWGAGATERGWEQEGRREIGAGEVNEVGDRGEVREVRLAWEQ